MTINETSNEHSRYFFPLQAYKIQANSLLSKRFNVFFPENRTFFRRFSWTDADQKWEKKNLSRMEMSFLLITAQREKNLSFRLEQWIQVMAFLNRVFCDIETNKERVRTFRRAKYAKSQRKKKWFVDNHDLFCLLSGTQMCMSMRELAKI